MRHDSPRLTHETPLAALETIDREIEAMCEDVPRPSSMLAARLDTVLQLLPVVTAAAHAPQYSADRDATVDTLKRMHTRQEALAAALRAELARVQAELVQVNTTARAARSYGASPQSSGSSALDRVG